MKPGLISTIVPAYKKEKTIVEDLKKILTVLSKLRYKTELICVVDGNVDNTFKKASTLTKKYKNLKVVGYETNKGKGYAVRFGMARSKGEIIAFIDSGMDLDPNGLSLLLEQFREHKADVIVGSKRHPLSKVTYPWQRRVLSFGYQILVRILFGLKIKDTQVGLKVFRRELLEKVLPRLLVKRFAFDIEMLSVAHHLGYKRMYEAPVEIDLDFGKDSVVTDKKFLKTVYLMIWDTLAVFYRLKILGYYNDTNKRKWKYDPELDYRVNVG